jgi:hypothetical protein
MTKRFILHCLALSRGATQILSAGSAKALGIQIVVDNDFAISPEPAQALTLFFIRIAMVGRPMVFVQ